MAGGFNSNVIRKVNRFLLETRGRFEHVRLSTIGRKGHDYFKNRPLGVRKDYPGVIQKVDYSQSSFLAQEFVDAYQRGEVDAVYLVYNEFLSAISQQVAMVKMIPLEASMAKAPHATSAVEFKFDPSRQGLIDRLVPQTLAIRMHRALLESVASEHGSRMAAMENATSNASDMIGNLTLRYNRTRQAAITKELMEIVGGAEALKG